MDSRFKRGEWSVYFLFCFVFTFPRSFKGDITTVLCLQPPELVDWEENTLFMSFRVFCRVLYALGLGISRAWQVGMSVSLLEVVRVKRIRNKSSLNK